MRKMNLSKMQLLFISLYLLFSPGVLAQKGNPVKFNPAVTCKWLEENIKDPDVVILHISTIALDFENGHIPGAKYLWPGYITTSTEKESNVPADKKEIAAVLARLGVSNNSHIILCGIYGNFIQVCRIYVTLDHIGLGDRVSVLEGGFDEWKSSGQQVAKDNPLSKKGRVVVTQKENFVDSKWMVDILKNTSYCIVDARLKNSYDGSTGTPRQGHIPGAKNLPATDLFDSKTSHFQDPGKLKEIFAALGLHEGVRPVFYCQTGNMASLDYVAAKIAGYDPLLYDGSMEEWGSRFDLPVEK